MPPSSSRAAFVTGGTGFVGLNLVKELMIRGWDVTALHRASSDLKLLKRFRPKLAVGALAWVLMFAYLGWQGRPGSNGAA